jgi:hypothetical protein
MIDDFDKLSRLIDATWLTDNKPDLIMLENSRKFGIKLNISPETKKLLENTDVKNNIIVALSTVVGDCSDDYEYYITENLEIIMQEKGKVYSSNDYKEVAEIDDKTISKIKNGVEKLFSNKVKCEDILNKVPSMYEIIETEQFGIKYQRLVKK